MRLAPAGIGLALIATLAVAVGAQSAPEATGVRVVTVDEHNAAVAELNALEGRVSALEASPEPTPTPDPTPTPTETTPDPEPTNDRPDASNTGVPDGVTLTPSGGLTITEAGTVLDGLHVRGRITVQADNVTIRRTLVQTATTLYPVTVQGDNVLIEDVEVDNLGSTGIGVFFSGGSGTVRRADIHSAEDGVRIQGNNITIEDSYIHDLQRQDGGHHDTVQIRRGDNVTLRGNTLLPYVEATDDPMNAALQIGSLLGDNTITNLRVLDNYLNGGNYTINGGGRGEVESALYSGNRFGRDYRYSVAGNIQNSTWDDTNVFDDTNQPVR